MAEGTKKTRIGGFDIELTLYEEAGEQRSDCFVMKNGKSASLTVVEGFGCLDCDAATERDSVPVPQATIEKIEQWALDNGY